MDIKDKKIIVLMGGPSAEREVSFNTGRAILGALKEKGYNAAEMDLNPQSFMEDIKKSGCAVVFNAVHGRYGEDGTVQGALELMGIPCTGSGLLANAMAMDKAVSKRIFIAENIPTPKSKIYTLEDKRRALASEIAAEFSFPVVVKAASQGSSIGVAIVEKQGDLENAVQDSFKYSDEIVVEEFIKGRELTVAVWGMDKKEALPVVEIVPHSGKYDYASKYTKGATDYIVPANLSDAERKAVQTAGVRAFKSLGCKGIARVDIMLGADGVPYVLEVNSVPGMTATSLVPKAAKAAGISFEDLCERLLLMAIQ
jgi:D-alanine--D-alanine ligase